MTPPSYRALIEWANTNVRSMQFMGDLWEVTSHGRLFCGVSLHRCLLDAYRSHHLS